MSTWEFFIYRHTIMIDAYGTLVSLVSRSVSPTACTNWHTGLAVPTETVYSQLRGILSENTPTAQHHVGYLTGINRDKWAELRKELVSSEKNRDAIRCIDSSMFVLCLDDSDPDNATDLSHNMLHNHGQNRWAQWVCLANKGTPNFPHCSL